MHELTQERGRRIAVRAQLLDARRLTLGSADDPERMKNERRLVALVER